MRLWLLGFLLLISTRLLVAQFPPPAFDTIGALPTQGMNKSGLVFYIARQGIPEVGYQTVLVRIIPVTGALTADRNLELVLRSGGWSYLELDYQFQRAVKVPQGMTVYDEVFQLPNYGGLQNLHIAIYEEGRLLEGCEGQFSLRTDARPQGTTVVAIVRGAMRRGQTQEEMPFPDLRTVALVLGQSLPSPFTPQRLTHFEARNFAASYPFPIRFPVLETQSLFDNWRSYQYCDVLLIPAPELKTLEARSSTKMEAIKRWVAAGGMLIAYGEGASQLEILSSSIAPELLPSNPNDELAAIRFFENLNLFPDVLTAKDLRQLFPPPNNQAMNAPMVPVPMDMGIDVSDGIFSPDQLAQIVHRFTKSGHPAAQALTSQELKQRVRLRPWGLGIVVGIHEDDPFPGSAQLWGTVFKRRQLGRLHGVNMQSAASRSDSFWYWALTTVGLPPVYVFIAMNTLLVITMGPVSYWYLRRHQRLYLLYFLAPTLALLITASLVVYSFVADGLGKQGRILSITWLDAAAGYEATESRQTYFSGLGGGEGLRFTEQQTVQPVNSEITPSNRIHRSEFQGRARHRIIQQDRDTLLFQGDFLPARTQVQYLSGLPQPTPRKITIDWQGKSPSIYNQTDMMLRDLVARDAQGNFWTASSIGAGAEMSLSPRPSPPGNLSDPETFALEWPRSFAVGLGYVDSTSRRNYYWNVSRTSLEQMLYEWLVDGKFPRGVFVASTDVTTDSLALPEAQPHDSIHILMGQVP